MQRASLPLCPRGSRGRATNYSSNLFHTQTRIAALYNPENPMHRRRYETEGSEIARQLGFKLIFVEATVPDQFETAFDHASNQGAQAIKVLGDALTYANSEKMVALAARYRLPAMYFFTRSVLDGGLMSFGPDLPYGWRAAAAYVDKILRGERPADIPVVQPTR
jgi:putative ABC transport system substrate-binding protein